MSSIWRLLEKISNLVMALPIMVGLLRDILEEQKKCTELLERIADTLDPPQAEQLVATIGPVEEQP